MLNICFTGEHIAADQKRVISDGSDVGFFGIPRFRLAMGLIEVWLSRYCGAEHSRKNGKAESEIHHESAILRRVGCYTIPTTFDIGNCKECFAHYAQ